MMSSGYAFNSDVSQHKWKHRHIDRHMSSQFVGDDSETIHDDSNFKKHNSSKASLCNSGGRPKIKLAHRNSDIDPENAVSTDDRHPEEHAKPLKSRLLRCDVDTKSSNMKSNGAVERDALQLAFSTTERSFR